MQEYLESAEAYLFDLFKPLTKALDALRNSKDLLTQVSKKEE